MTLNTGNASGLKTPPPIISWITQSKIYRNLYNTAEMYHIKNYWHRIGSFRLSYTKHGDAFLVRHTLLESVWAVAAARWGRGWHKPSCPKSWLAPHPKFSRTLDTLWSTNSQKNQQIWCHQMSDFKAKMHKIRFPLHGAPPQTPLG